MVEDAQTLRLSPSTSSIWKEVVHGPCMFVKPGPGDFEPPAGGFDSVMKITVLSAMHACMALAYEPVVTLEMQRGEQEFAVAALLIWSTTAAAHKVLSRVPLHRIPLSKWDQAAKGWLVEVRQLGRIDGAAEDQRYLAWSLRRLMALSGRTADEADWEKEKADRMTKCVAKFAYLPGLGISQHAYEETRERVLHGCAATAVGLLKDRPGDLWNWWKRRARNTPAGSSSRHKDLKVVIKDLPGVDMEMRPTKKAVAELFTEKDLRDWLRMTPRCIARTSTKHEPARKNRALFAQDDEGAAIAAFASEGMERTMKTGGMVLSQMPEDVKEWIAAEAQNVYMVSNDYTNFNILHSPGDLAAVSIAMAKEWYAHYVKSGKARSLQKAVCEIWTAESYKLMLTQGKESYRVTCGLYSGHRNTARDNTLLHKVYLTATQSVMAHLLDSHERPVFERMSGDDEVVHYRTWHRAVLHPLVADGAGYKSKVEKGLLARGNDEFLQFMRHPGNMPTYPIAHTILTFCSGNWYKTPVRDLAATIPAMEDHAWDLVLGGVPVFAARKLAGSALDYIMQTKTKGVLKPKEWWAYRGSYETGGHPLWGHSLPEGPIPDVEREALGTSTDHLPSHAVQDMITTEAKYWQHATEGEIMEAKRQRTVEAFSSVMRHELTSRYDEAADKVWPDRSKAWTDIPEDLAEASTKVSTPVLRRLRAHKPERDPPSVFAVCMRYNIPPEMARRSMGEVLQVADPRARAELLAAINAPERRKAKCWAMPGLLRTAT